MARGVFNREQLEDPVGECYLLQPLVCSADVAASTREEIVQSVAPLIAQWLTPMENFDGFEFGIHEDGAGDQEALERDDESGGQQDLKVKDSSKTSHSICRVVDVQLDGAPPPRLSEVKVRRFRRDSTGGFESLHGGGMQQTKQLYRSFQSPCRHCLLIT